jgi:hypothetical protein
MLQKFAKVEVSESAQALCQFCREQQSSSEPLRWIAGANPPPLFVHEFLNSHRFRIHGIHRSLHNRLENGSTLPKILGRLSASAHVKKSGVDGRTREARVKTGRSRRTTAKKNR